MPYVKVNNFNMFYEIHGKGKPLVFIHGASGSKEGWVHQVPEFAKQYKVITMDLRGHGQSDKPDMPYSIKLFTDDVSSLLDYLDVQESIIVGISMGGMVAQQFVLDHPQKVRRLVLVDTMSHTDQCLRMKWETGFLIAEKLGMEAQVRNGIPWVFSPSYINENLNEIMENTKESAAIPFKIYAQIVNACLSHDVRTLLHKIHVPTLVVVGDQDILTPRYYSEFLCKEIQGSRLTVIEDSGHVPVIEQPERFNRILMDFLKKI